MRIGQKPSQPRCRRSVESLDLKPYYHSSIVSNMPRGNPALKLAITVDRDVHDRIVEAAEAEGSSISAWITRAAREALRIRDGLAAVAEWETEHGVLTEAELDAARQRLSAPGSVKVSPGAARKPSSAGRPVNDNTVKPKRRRTS